MNYRLIVAGSRDFDTSNNEKAILHFIAGALIFNNIDISSDNIEICHGDCRGVDQVAKVFSKKYNLECFSFPANWNEHGKAAGPIRNEQMAEWACEGDRQGILVVIKKPDSRGSSHMISCAKKRNMKIIEVNVFSS